MAESRTFLFYIWVTSHQVTLDLFLLSFFGWWFFCPAKRINAWLTFPLHASSNSDIVCFCSGVYDWRCFLNEDRRSRHAFAISWAAPSMRSRIRFPGVSSCGGGALMAHLPFCANNCVCVDIPMKQSALLHAHNERCEQTDSKNHIARGCEAPRPSCTSRRHAAARRRHVWHTRLLLWFFWLVDKKRSSALWWLVTQN